MCATGAGDYDYEDSHGLPAGCQYLTAQSSDITPAGAPAPARSGAMPAGMAPVQAPPPSAYTGRRALLSVSPSYLAPAPAPEQSSRDIQIAPAAQDASSSSSATQPGLYSLLCRPIAAKMDAPSSSGISYENIILIVMLTVIPGSVIIAACIGIYCIRGGSSCTRGRRLF